MKRNIIIALVHTFGVGEIAEMFEVATLEYKNATENNLVSSYGIPNAEARAIETSCAYLGSVSEDLNELAHAIMDEIETTEEDKRALFIEALRFAGLVDAWETFTEEQDRIQKEKEEYAQEVSERA